MKELKTREEILRKQREKHIQLLQLRLADHEQQLASFIKTRKEPRLFWLPKKHNNITEKLLQETELEAEQRIEEGLVADRGGDDEYDEIPAWKDVRLRKTNESNAEEEPQGEHKTGEGEEKDDDGNEKDTNKDDAAGNGSPAEGGEDAAAMPNDADSGDTNNENGNDDDDDDDDDDGVKKDES
mmetsp:Transcript_699/g.1232  ORF Transcript_699/g.1232 Transcript_699/m.1232 type:complete len:183 (+) Transcript_699:416-964(+)